MRNELFDKIVGLLIKHLYAHSHGDIMSRMTNDIEDAMVKIMKGRTSIIIAHRLSTIQGADVIVVMDKGRIVETGNHESLLEQKGKYHDLYLTQYAGYAT
jgi:ATP-binding cassette subfamily B protein